MRIFRLYNADGAVYDLTKAGASFYYNVAGLGFELSSEFQRVGERFELVRSLLNQKRITGKVKFWQPNAYKDYFDFAQFCQNAPLKLEYVPEHGSFLREGVCSTIVKTESGDGALEATFEFDFTTPWYKTVYEYNEGALSDGKRYDYKYDYVYSNTVAQSVTIDSDSYQPSPVIITIYGRAVNPMWRHYVNGNLVITGRVNGEIEVGRKLVIDTTSIPFTIRQYDLSDNLISDMYQQSDFSTERFVRLGYGRNIISVQQEGTGIVRLGVEARIEYTTV